MLFSMLANLAEDRQGVATEQDADLAAAIARLNAEGIGADAVIDLLDHGLIAPVLTAHPTEVRRKSMIDHRNRIADLMALKDRGLTATPDGDDVRSEEHTSELQSLMRISYAVFCLKQKKKKQ